jgi:hypothetical protein
LFVDFWSCCLPLHLYTEQSSNVFAK